MAPSELRRQTISQLRKTFLAMMSPRWDRALEGKSDARLTEAARTLLAVQRARLRLGNAKLAGIRDDLKANEADLASGITALNRSLKKLGDVKAVLATTTSLLRTVGRIVDIVL